MPLSPVLHSWQNCETANTKRVTHPTKGDQSGPSAAAACVVWGFLLLGVWKWLLFSPGFCSRASVRWCSIYVIPCFPSQRRGGQLTPINHGALRFVLHSLNQYLVVARERKNINWPPISELRIAFIRWTNTSMKCCCLLSLKFNGPTSQMLSFFSNLSVFRTSYDFISWILHPKLVLSSFNHCRGWMLHHFELN